MEDFEKTRALREMARTTDTHTLFRELVFLTRRGARHEGGNNIFGCRLAAIYRAEILRRIPPISDARATTPSCRVPCRVVEGRSRGGEG